LYFWNLRSLRTSLISPPLPWEQCGYLAGLFLIWGLPIPTAIALGSVSEDNFAIDFASLAIALGGVRFAYGCNGGASGRDFAVRVVAIAWVVGVRFTVMLLALSLLAIYPGMSLAVEFASRLNIAVDDGAKTASTVLLYGALAMQGLYWWVVGRQIRGIPAAA